MLQFALEHKTAIKYDAFTIKNRCSGEFKEVKRSSQHSLFYDQTQTHTLFQLKNKFQPMFLPVTV